MPEASGWLLLRGSVPAWLLLPSLVLMAVCSPHAGTVAAGTSCVPRCYCSESEGKTVRCSHLHLTHVPAGIPNDTHRLYLDYNQLASVPTDAFLSLPLLRELDLSHNDLSILEPGAFRGLGPSLKFLDLSSNSLATLNPDAFEGLTARSNLTGNPWHCDCTLQSVLPRLDLEPVSLTGIVCHSAEPADTGAEGQALLLTQDLDLCVVMKKTTDVAMLVTMFGWFSMVISYLVYYVRGNQEDARRHLEYLKSLPGLPKSEESSTISTVV